MLESISRHLLLIGSGLLLAGPVQSVVISTGDGTGNTTPPPNDFGYDLLGVTSDAFSGVYLGFRWVLTANHVGVRDIRFLGQLHTAVPGSEVRLQNPDSSFADLLVYRLETGPPLAGAVLSSATPSRNDLVHCVGNGWNREPGETHWNALWNEVQPPPPAAFTGYKRGAGKTVRWGRNKISTVGTTVFSTESFEMTFDDSGGLADESQAVGGDSGSGCFIERNGIWELVGLQFASSTFGDGPGPGPDQPSNTAVFGNESIAADVFFYRDQIEAITTAAIPGPGRGWHLLLVALLGATPRPWLARAGHERP